MAEFGDPRLPQRFWAKILVRDDGCWEWTARRHDQGYGQFRVAGKTLRAHVFAYENLVDAVPEGLVLDHVCRNEWCVNPACLEPVTQRVNVLRGEGVAAKFAQRTKCGAGHEFTQANTLLRSDGGRRCRECKRERGRVAA